MNCLVVNPTFDSQTKENLTLKPAKFGPKEFDPTINDKFLDKIAKSMVLLVEFFLSKANIKSTNSRQRHCGQRSVLGQREANEGFEEGGRGEEVKVIGHSQIG